METKQIINKPRQATTEEKQELIDKLVEMGYDREDETQTMDHNYIAVFDHYISDCPGYAGKLMVVVWGYPEAYDAFIWIDGKITKVEQQ